MNECKWFEPSWSPAFAATRIENSNFSLDIVCSLSKHQIDGISFIILPSKTTHRTRAQQSPPRRLLLHFNLSDPSLLEFCEEWTACATQSILQLICIYRERLQKVYGHCTGLLKSVTELAEDCCQVQLWMRGFKIRLSILRKKKCK